MANETIKLVRGIYVYEELEIPREEISDRFLARYEGGSLTNVIEDLAKEMGTTPEAIDARPGWREASRMEPSDSDDYELEYEDQAGRG
jgi:hypothetical protein